MKTVKPKDTPRSVGRPRSFKKDEALDQALQVFWSKGFEGASLCDLTAATGLKPASLYAAFGNKQALFEQALGRYVAEQLSFLQQALAEPTALAVVQNLLRRTADFLSCPGHPRGCLTIGAALSSGEEAEPVRRLLIDMRRNFQELLRERFERAKAEGDLPPGEDAADWANFLATVLQGMAIQAINGASREELLRVGEITGSFFTRSAALPKAVDPESAH